MDNFRIGDAIRLTKTSKHMTQKQLGELVGVKRAQISKLENGKSGEAMEQKKGSDFTFKSNPFSVAPSRIELLSKV